MAPESTVWSGPSGLVPVGARPRWSATWPSSTSRRGLGVIEYGTGNRIAFHCTAITDGSRQHRVGDGRGLRGGRRPARTAGGPVGAAPARRGRPRARRAEDGVSRAPCSGRRPTEDESEPWPPAAHRGARPRRPLRAAGPGGAPPELERHARATRRADAAGNRARRRGSRWGRDAGRSDAVGPRRRRPPPPRRSRPPGRGLGDAVGRSARRAPPVGGQHRRPRHRPVRRRSGSGDVGPVPVPASGRCRPPDSESGPAVAPVDDAGDASEGSADPMDGTDAARSCRGSRPGGRRSRGRPRPLGPPSAPVRRRHHRRCLGATAGSGALAGRRRRSARPIRTSGRPSPDRPRGPRRPGGRRSPRRTRRRPTGD